MTNKITCQALKNLLEGHAPFALIDIREAGEYNSSHIPGASPMPRRQLEFLMRHAVPHPSTPVVLCDDDGRRAPLAADTVERMGYKNVSVLEGGINRWVTEGLPTEWGTNVPSKDFGEKVEVVHHVPELEATDLAARMRRGDKLVILDARTPEEFRRFCIPGGRNVPGGELSLRITDITRTLDRDTTIIVNCAGRTRSIIGTRVLQRMGLQNVLGLKNGTAGWVLAGEQLETGAAAERTQLSAPSPEAVAAAEAYAARLAAEDGVRYLDIESVERMRERLRREAVYLIDVRTVEEYAAGHIPGFRWFPGGQAVQRSDEAVVVKHCPIVFCCDGKARSTLIASWYRQMGFEDVYAVDGGTVAWAASGRSLDKGMLDDRPFGHDEARAKATMLSPAALQAQSPASVIFVDTSLEFAGGHVPGARWISRGWLELTIGDLGPAKSTVVAGTCVDGRSAVLAGATLNWLGYERVSVLDGGMVAWQKAGLPVEKGLSGVMSPPADVVPYGPDRNSADMQNYLRWEEALGRKYSVTKPA